MYTQRSAIAGWMSSLNASFNPSARDCSNPKGPTRLGPGRCCMRPTTRRSIQIMNKVMTIRNTKITTTFTMISHSGSSPSSASVGVMTCLPAASWLLLRCRPGRRYRCGQ